MKNGFCLSKHCIEMLAERGLTEELIEICLSRADRVEDRDDLTRHFCAKLKGSGKWLRVVVNMATEPKVVVTAFLDRRIKE